MQQVSLAGQCCRELFQTGWYTFYQPDQVAINQGQTVFIPQGLVVFGIFTIIWGELPRLDGLFDAFTDPMIASLSDRCTSKHGRRIPFLKWASLPLALSTVLVFWSPVNKNSRINAVFLLVMILAYYLSNYGILYTVQCADSGAWTYAAGAAEYFHCDFLYIIVGNSSCLSGTDHLGHVYSGIWKSRCNPCDFYDYGSDCIYLHACSGVLYPGKKIMSIQVPAKESAFRSLVETFKNGEFRKFVGSDIFYWIALTMFQTGLPFFVTSLLRLPETMTTIYFVGMTALSLVFYIPVNKLTPKIGKKKMILFAFVVFSLAYFYTGFMGKISFIPENVQGLILMVVAALPMAIFGILPQAVVADIAQSDAITSGSNREGMFYAARTFAFKLGQSLSMLIFTAVSTIGAGNGTGYRIAAFGAAAFCCVGGIILVFYNEKRINGIISGK